MEMNKGRLGLLVELLKLQIGFRLEEELRMETILVNKHMKIILFPKLSQIFLLPNQHGDKMHCT